MNCTMNEDVEEVYDDVTKHAMRSRIRDGDLRIDTAS